MSNAKASFVVLNLGVLLLNVACVVVSHGGVAEQVQAQENAPPKKAVSLDVSELRVVDKDGRVRIKLGSDEEGYPQCVLTDAKGSERMRLRVIADGPEVELFGDGAESAWIHCRSSIPAFSVSDKTGFTKATLGIESGTPKVMLTRGTGNTINETSGLALLEVSSAGGRVKLLGNGKESAKLKVKSSFLAGMTDNGNAWAAIYDEDMKVVWQAP